MIDWEEKYVTRWREMGCPVRFRPDSYSSSDNESGMDSGGSWGTLS